MKHYKERHCPGCGNLERRAPQTLCPNCHRQLKVGKEREREIKSLQVSGEKIRVAIGTRFHYGSDAHVSFLSIRDWDVLDALARLAGLESACEAGDTYTEAYCIHYELSFVGGYRNRPHLYVFATQDQADDIELILDYIKEAIIKAYSDGEREGSSLIRQLATAGTKELNRITTGTNDRSK